MTLPPPRYTLFPYTTLFRSDAVTPARNLRNSAAAIIAALSVDSVTLGRKVGISRRDRKSTRLNSSHSQISYAVFCLKKKKKQQISATMSMMYHEGHICVNGR